MSSVVTACAYAVVCAAVIMSVRSARPEFTLPLVCAASIGLVLLCIDAFVSSQSVVLKLFNSINTDYLKLIVKAGGICIIGELAGDICRDCGMTSIASGIDTVCRFGICLLSVPLLVQAVGSIAEICGV